MEEVIIFKTSVTAYLIELVDILFAEDYFSYKESSQEYVNKLYDNIYADLPKSIKHHQTPLKLKKYGNFYLKVKGSKRTMWYVFFDKYNHRYIVEFITNNHTPQGAHFNKL
ncbi:MAG: hypothetical protein KF900_07935 [Bacteroidetes bacterium]|nr:hypothetical protein [Bacteroidota bacterium]